MSGLVTLSDYMEYVVKSQFPQYNLLNSNRFSGFLKDMEIDISEDYLEYLDRTGIIRPVMRLQRPNDGTVIVDNYLIRDNYLNSGLVEFPKDGDYKPWASFKPRGITNTDIFYHPVQFIAFPTLVPRRAMAPWQIEQISDPTQFVNQLKDGLATSKDLSTQAYRGVWTRRIGLLLLLEEAYAPVVRGSRAIGFFTDNDSVFKSWRDWRLNKFSLNGVLSISGMTIDEVKQLHTNLAFQGHIVDPLAPWYAFQQYIQRSKMGWLKGKARRAQEYYILAHMVKQFLHDLTGEELPEPDELDEPKYKNRFYKVKNFDYRKRKHRTKVINDFLVQQLPQMAIVVEGDTEEFVVSAILDALRVRREREGLVLYNAKGSNLDRNIEGYVESAKANNINVFAIVDRDKEQLIKDLLKKKTIKKKMHKIWHNDFEYDNFKFDRLLEYVNSQLTKKNYSRLNNTDVRKKMRSVSSFMLALDYENRRVNGGHELYRLIAKKQIARSLIKNRIKEIEIEYLAGKWKPKLPIERVIKRIFDMIPPRSY